MRIMTIMEMLKTSLGTGYDILLDDVMVERIFVLAGETHTINIIY